ncbi:MAG: ribonuclease HII [Firmicutes bacterium]|jgi:ribonuclease HII|nr:ribonuclease HII [Bacillota bacterium]
MMKVSSKEIKEIIASASTIEDMKEIIDRFKDDERKTVQKLMMSLNKKIIKIIKEEERIAMMWEYEKKSYSQGYEVICGIDEAGRGPLAGPVVAGAVILPKDVILPGVNDSKKLSEQKRDELFDLIKEKALYWSVGIVDNNVIDEINILNATKVAMLEAVDKLGIKPEKLLIDAVNLDTEIPQESMYKGDEKSISIAAASIIAKVIRDRMMEEYDKELPGYQFSKHKGYGTKEHYQGIDNHGISKIHRMTFLKNYL